jgi:hypothetical protein
VLAVETIRGVNGRPKVEAEIRYFLSSCRTVASGTMYAVVACRSGFPMAVA